jgi:hypothetical protein
VCPIISRITWDEEVVCKKKGRDSEPIYDWAVRPKGFNKGVDKYKKQDGSEDTI